MKSIPGRKFVAGVSYIDPFIDPLTRSAGVRVEVENPHFYFKPGMFATGIIQSFLTESREELIVPKSSVLWTGKRSVVYVKVQEREMPSFVYREIELGLEASEYYIVKSGLSEGEEIATNGVFKIDAAAQLEGKQSMMSPEVVDKKVMHDHGKMDTLKQSVIRSETEIPDSFRKQVTELYYAYIKLKDAFVGSDVPLVRKEAEKALNTLNKADMSLLEGELHMKWMDQHGELAESLKAIIDSVVMETQRKHFLSLNNTFYLTVKTFGLKIDTVYYQYCPMADDNNGGYWLSNEKEIRNPYFGDMMLKCGEVRETIIN